MLTEGSPAAFLILRLFAEEVPNPVAEQRCVVFGKEYCRVCVLVGRDHEVPNPLRLKAIRGLSIDVATKNQRLAARFVWLDKPV